MGDMSTSRRPSDHSLLATYWTERRCEEIRQEEPGNDNYSEAVQILKTSYISSFCSFRCFIPTEHCIALLSSSRSLTS